MNGILGGMKKENDKLFQFLAISQSHHVISSLINNPRRSNDSNNAKTEAYFFFRQKGRRVNDNNIIGSLEGVGDIFTVGSDNLL